ncbi:hypothetical protein IE53DRAFT_235554 [Violaceomyces palustris]|uniref:Uncharacterized protein n=1 Tax=Violaceomyces palustris TaxID=1673888 RepID=A0ACD0NPI8_9BASI|nr:hypothetical protein IE53DRAFT_235554 [Violaceomyces palustris]
MPKDKSEPKKTVKRACDACHHRRVRCNHNDPCDNCVRLGTQCTWYKAKKGKQASGKRIEYLRRGFNPALSDDEQRALVNGERPSGIHVPIGGPSTESAGFPPPSHYPPNGASPPASHHAPMHPPTSRPGIEQSQSWRSYGSPNSNGDASRQPLMSQSLYHSQSSPQSYTYQHRRYSSTQNSQPSPPQHASSSRSTLPHGGAGLSFNPSINFGDVIGSAFSEIPAETAATFRLPDFGTSLADTYFNGQQDTSRRNGLLGMSHFSNSPDNQHSHHHPQRPTVLDALNHSSSRNGGPGSTPGSATSSQEYSLAQGEPNPLAESVLIVNIGLFFDRLHAIMPVFTRTWIYSRLDRNDHHTDPQFGAMLIAMSAFAIWQPVEASTPEETRARKHRVKYLLQEAVKMRSGAFFGQSPCLEAVMASFFIFGTLFGLGEESAAWFRLREAVTLGHLLRLHEPAAYEELEKDEQERRLRAYWLLAITERAYAIQSGHAITFRGHPRESTKAISRKFAGEELRDFPNHQLRLFDAFDEKFVDCWNKQCPGKGCDYLNTQVALQLHRAISNDQEESESDSHRLRAPDDFDGRQRSHSDSRRGGVREERMPPVGGAMSQATDWAQAKTQKADVDITRQWLLNRLWLTCLSHGLVSSDSPHECLQVSYAIDIARQTLRVCNSLTLRSMEAHGIGLTRKLNDIAQTLVLICRDFPDVALSLPFEGDPMNLRPYDYGPTASPPFSHSSPHQVAPTGGVGADSTGSLSANYDHQHHHHHERADSQPGPTPSSSTTASSANMANAANVMAISNFDASNSSSSSSSSSHNHHQHHHHPRPPSLLDIFSPSFAIEAILHKYLEIFKKFRGGDHPYLDELIQSINRLPKMAELSFDKFLKELDLIIPPA